MMEKHYQIIMNPYMRQKNKQNDEEHQIPKLHYKTNNNNNKKKVIWNE